VFISSTSRWVLPVGQLVMPDKTTVRAKSTELTEKLYKLLLENVVANSTPM
jgi:branched-subunit amino acid aminotransferase/4-amino-4-deoxychorismate lyase